MRTRRASRGQALTELAVFGSVFLLALTFLLRIGLRFNFQQDASMRAFRAGLNEANRRAGRDSQVPGVSYVIMEDRQVPTAGDPFGLNARTRFTGRAALTYGKHLMQIVLDPEASRPGHDFFRINNQQVLITSDQLPAGAVDDDDHTLADHDAGAGYGVNVARNTLGPARATLLRAERGGHVQTMTVGRSDEEAVTEWVLADREPMFVAPIRNQLTQQTLREHGGGP